MSVGRDRRVGGRRSRSHHSDESLPAPGALRQTATEEAALLSIIALAYAREYELGWPPGGAGLHVMASPTDATVAALLSPDQEDARARCRLASARVNEAMMHLRSAASLLTEGEVTQPAERSHDTVLERHEFESAKAQSEHKRRERELRA